VEFPLAQGNCESRGKRVIITRVHSTDMGLDKEDYPLIGQCPNFCV
jgi:hypothetical protein